MAGGSPRTSTPGDAGALDRPGDPQSPFCGTKCKFYIPRVQRRPALPGVHCPPHARPSPFSLDHLRLCSGGSVPARPSPPRCSAISVPARLSPSRLGHLRRRVVSSRLPSAAFPAVFRRRSALSACAFGYFRRRFGRTRRPPASLAPVTVGAGSNEPRPGRAPPGLALSRPGTGAAPLGLGDQEAEAGESRMTVLQEPVQVPTPGRLRPQSPARPGLGRPARSGAGAAGRSRRPLGRWARRTSSSSALPPAGARRASPFSLPSPSPRPRDRPRSPLCPPGPRGRCRSPRSSSADSAPRKGPPADPPGDLLILRSPFCVRCRVVFKCSQRARIPPCRASEGRSFFPRNWFLRVDGRPRRENNVNLLFLSCFSLTAVTLMGFLFLCSAFSSKSRDSQN